MRAPGGGLSDRSHWRSLGPVGVSTSLITQRSLVQIQLPQPTDAPEIVEVSGASCVCGQHANASGIREVSEFLTGPPAQTEPEER